MIIDGFIFKMFRPRIWEASGHVGAFNDPLIDNKDSKKRYRADVLLEDYIAKLEEKINKDVEKGRKKFGDAFDEEQFRATNPNVLRNAKKIAECKDRMVAALNANDLDALLVNIRRNTCMDVLDVLETLSIVVCHL